MVSDSILQTETISLMFVKINITNELLKQKAPFPKLMYIL